MQFTKNGIHVTVPDVLVQGLVARAAIERLNDEHDDELDFGALATNFSRPEIPAIGQAWLDQGGIYAGVIRGRDGERDYHLIVGDEAESELNWDAANKWCSEFRVRCVSGSTEYVFSDFTLPFRREQSVLFGNVPELFKELAYWSREQHAGYGDNAWAQLFNDGLQSTWGKHNELRARAVRRLAIQ